MHSNIQSGRRRGCTMWKSSFTCLFSKWKWKPTRFKAWICECAGFTLKGTPKQYKPLDCRSWNRLDSPCKGSCLELFINWPGLFFRPAGTIYKLSGTIYKLAGTILNQPELFWNWATRWSRLFLILPGLMTWPIVFIILPAALPKFKICTSLASSGFAKLSFAASQRPEHLIEPMPNCLGHDSITWLLGTALCNHRFLYSIQSISLAVRP